MYTLMGYDPISFPDQQSGEVIEGIRFHLVAAPESSSVKYGVDVLTIFIKNNRIMGTPTLGAACDLKFSLRNGKATVSGIEIKK